MSWLAIYVVFHCIVGALFMYIVRAAMKDTKQAWKVKEERDGKHPAFRWHGSTGVCRAQLFYLLAFIRAPIALIVCICFGFTVAVANILTIGEDLSKGQLTPWKGKVIRFCFKIGIWIGPRASMMWYVNRTDPEVDYSEYLGPNWKKEVKERTKPVSTLMCNHSSFLDLWLLESSSFGPSFVSKEGVRKTPIGPQGVALQCIFLDEMKSLTKDE